MYDERHTYYHTCEYCGANLDPGESCDCQKQTDDEDTTSTNYRDVTHNDSCTKNNQTEEK